MVAAELVMSRSKIQFLACPPSGTFLERETTRSVAGSMSVSPSGSRGGLRLAGFDVQNCLAIRPLTVHTINGPQGTNGESYSRADESIVLVRRAQVVLINCAAHSPA